MKKALDGIGFFVICVIEIIVGMVVLFDPQPFTRAVLLVVGIGLIAYGAIDIFAYFRSDPVVAAMGLRLTRGIITLGSGILLVAKPELISSILGTMVVVFGVSILVLGIYKIQAAVDMYRLGRRLWYVSLITALFSLAFAALILANPLFDKEAFVIFIGVCIVVEGVFDLVFFFASKSTDNR